MTNTTDSIEQLARAAGRAGRDWSAWICDDDVQAYVDDHGDVNVGAWEAAYREGLADYRTTPLDRGGGGWLTRWTTAPADYDTFGTVTTEDCGDWHGRALRQVIIAPRNLAYQEARYGSGLHGAWDRDPRVAEREAAEQAARYRAEQAAREARRVAAIEWLRTAGEDEIAAIEDADTIESRGLTYGDLRTERKRRAEVAAEAERADAWARCRAAFQDGAILIDDGQPAERGPWGVIPGRPAHVYYACRVANDWRKVADDATVQDSAGEVAGSLASVADRIASGQLRIVTADDVPPEPVTRRIGHDRYREIRRMMVDGRAAWVGRCRFARDPLVLDERGHIVRARRVRDTALREYAASGTP